MSLLSGPTLEVDLAAIAVNYRILVERHATKHCAAVVKANAYGLGIKEVSQTLASVGCTDFFVATLAEAIELRGILTEARIGVFNGLQPGEEDDYSHYRLLPVLNDVSQVERFSSASALTSAILHVDTGMTRLGLSESELKQLIDKPVIKTIRLLMSHLACANEPNDPKNAEQLMRFKAAKQLLPGIPTSFANSSGLFLNPDFHGDLGRPGCALYGITPVAGKNPMRHVATLSAPLLQIRTLDRKETIGYGATYDAPKGARIAIAAMGYADGILRALSNKSHAYIAGHKVPFAGRVSMDMIALDVSSIAEDTLTGARAEFINAQQTVNHVASEAGTIGYEIFTRIGARVSRLYRPL